MKPSEINPEDFSILVVNRENIQEYEWLIGYYGFSAPEQVRFQFEFTLYRDYIFNDRLLISPEPPEIISEVDIQSFQSDNVQLFEYLMPENILQACFFIEIMMRREARIDFEDVKNKIENCKVPENSLAYIVKDSYGLFTWRYQVEMLLSFEENASREYILTTVKNLNKGRYSTYHDLEKIQYNKDLNYAQILQNHSLRRWYSRPLLDIYKIISSIHEGSVRGIPTLNIIRELI
jgi:hypothetical protein